MLVGNEVTARDTDATWAWTTVSSSTPYRLRRRSVVAVKVDVGTVVHVPGHPAWEGHRIIGAPGKIAGLHTDFWAEKRAALSTFWFRDYRVTAVLATGVRIHGPLLANHAGFIDIARDFEIGLERIRLISPDVLPWLVA